MRVAIFASAFHPSLGGVEELVRQLAHAYRAHGVPTIVMTDRWPRTLPTFEEFEGIPVYRLDLWVPAENWKSRARFLLQHHSTRRQMLEILRVQQIDLMHVQCVSNNGYYASIASKALGLPLVVTGQGELTMDATQVYQRSAFLRSVLRQLLEEADYVTACSKDTLAELERFHGRPLGARASVVYNGIRLQEFAVHEQLPCTRPYILGIGRFVPQKGFDILIRAFAAADLESHDLVVAGDGPERASLQQLASGLGLLDRVKFPGRADRRMAVRLFQDAAFFVLPSRHEPMGIVNMEAMAAGKAVIASRVGGVPEIVQDGETGLLVPGGDVGILAAAIKRMASDKPLQARMGRAGRACVEQFDWDVIARQYHNIYHRLSTQVSEVERVPIAI